MWFLLPLVCFFATALAYDTLTLSRAPIYDVGHKCQPNEKGEIAGIRYFVDQERYVIYPFFYLGCGGEEFNRYKSRRDAVAGLPMDFSACTGWSTSEAMCGGPRLPGDTGEECPKGTVCEMGAFFGQCCSKEVAARYNENRKATCPKKSRGAQKYTDEDQKRESIEFGRSCTHNFCQKGAICIEGEFEAYCCLN